MPSHAHTRDRINTLTSYRLGDRDDAIGRIKTMLAATAADRAATTPAPGREQSPDFDSALDRRVRAFQQQRGLIVDGIVGNETWEGLVDAAQRLGDRLLSFSSMVHKGDDVADLQERLLHLGFDAGRADGVFGKRTESALRMFQAERGLFADGVCGPLTLRDLLTVLGQHIRGGNPNELREDVRLRRQGPFSAGRLVVIDAGHGGTDTGFTGNGIVERDIVHDIAERLTGRLLPSGVEVLPAHGLQESPSEAHRARAANQAGASAVVSIHLDSAESPAHHGAATYFFGSSPDRGSVVGARLADLVQREVVSRTDLLDCRTHPKTWELLRLTKMPAIRLEAGFVSNPDDASRLADPGFRDALADALHAAVQRLFLPQELDQPTGAIRLPLGVFAGR